MLTVPHVITGAAIGSLMPDLSTSNVLAFGFGWLSHYVLDTLPHRERLFAVSSSPSFTTSQPIKYWPRDILYVAVVDVVLACVGLALILWWLPGEQLFWKSPIFWGAIGAVAPDLLDNMPFWSRSLASLPFFRHQRHFHKTVHISRERQMAAPSYLGLTTQVVTVMISLGIILWTSLKS